MSKLGIKLIFSYIIIVLISTYVFMTKTSDSILEILLSLDSKEIIHVTERLDNLFYKSLNGESRKDGSNFPQGITNNAQNLEIAVDGQIYTVPIVDINTSLSYSTNVFVFDNSQKLVYSNTDRYIDYDLSNVNMDLKVFEKRQIKAGDKSVGYFLVTGKNYDEGDEKNTIYKAFYNAFLITMLLALIISLVFEISIVGPIGKLRDNIKSFSLEKDMKWKRIRTGDELTDVNNEFLSMAKKLQKLNQKQKTFFQNSSHELKTPLMSIQGYAEAIRDGVMEENKEEGLNIIIDECIKLRNTINSIIFISDVLGKDESNMENFEKVYLYDLIEEAKRKLEYAGVENTNQIDILNLTDEKIRLTIDVKMLERVITNLISNALRYAENKIIIKGYIDINNLVITVEDDGKGFDEKDIDLVFERFYKGVDGNSGLGLSIVKSIIEIFNGEVKAYKSESLGGAGVEIRLKGYLFNLKIVEDESI